MGGTNKTITIKKCSNCGKDVEIKHKKRLEAINTFCCKECESKYKKKQVVYNCKCSFCNKKIHVKPNLLEKYKTHFCSKECFSKYKKDYFKGENNHQYGLKGELNCCQKCYWEWEYGNTDNERKGGFGSSGK